MEKVAFFFHILGVMLLMAGVVVAGRTCEAARWRQQPSEIASLLGLTRVGVVLVAAGTRPGGRVRARGSCTWGDGAMARAGSTRRSFLLVVVIALGGRRPKQARLLASRLAEHDAGPMVGCVRCSMTESLAAEHYGSLLLVLVIIALMVLKPCDRAKAR